MVPVFSFTILWIGISFRVYTVVKGDGTNEMKSELVYIQIIIIISSGFGWLDPRPFHTYYVPRFQSLHQPNICHPPKSLDNRRP